MLSTNKNFKVISLTIGKSVDECHRYYYGHYKSSSDYYIFKQMRRLKLIDNEIEDDSMVCTSSIDMSGCSLSEYEPDAAIKDAFEISASN